MKILELAENVLKESSESLTCTEIWEIAVKNGLTEKLNSNGKTPWASLGAQLYISVRDDPKSKFVKVGSYPAKFSMKNISNQIEKPNLLSKKTNKTSYLEKDLHPFLVYFARNFLGFRTKTINHTISTKKEFGEWVHPDVVGCYFPYEDMTNEVWELSSAIGNVSVKLASFELKKDLNFSNLRESFFQTVSNSTWANEAYLVAASIDEDSNFMAELSRLSTSFGVGVIKLDIEDPDSSIILLQSKKRENLDWQTMQKLSTMNLDFKDFITTIKIDINSKRIHSKEYDEVLDVDALKKTIKKG